MNRLARMMALTLALLCLFTIGAGAAVAHLMPHRLALFQLPAVAGRSPARPETVLRAATGSPSGGAGGADSGVATAAGVTARVDGLVKSGGLGPHVGALVSDLSTGQVLYKQDAASSFAPASTTKIATAVAALETLGPDATFSTRVLVGSKPGAGGEQIVLLGGGDPTLAVHPYPAGDYPQPATLGVLAAGTARALRANGVSSVTLRYDASLFGGPAVARGWKPLGAPGNYVSSGNVTPITGLEVDQGRLTAHGTPQDSDDAGNFRPRSLTPSRDAARAFAALLRKDGITVRGKPSAGRAPHAARVIALVRSPSLAAIVQQMLTESNNVIAETLARHVAIATGRPGTFAGAAAGVMAVVARLKVHGLRLHDGSGLSPMDRISPRALVSLIGLAARSGAGLRPVLTGLPVAGFSGTLGPGSFFGPFGRAALGMVRAKTGNLTHVATMAGVAATANGQLLAFAFMGNDIPVRLGGKPESTLAQLATALAGCGCG
ncbi:MAG TPA: D-alanyl-D-alanine carboxypeptidase/D-alanyl-D-alanine-endopeptidase [Streptosporangiaceae bacterium]|nr:D-alanyl-D-alanine carboxypeptidase/D-alanyl-D-alanine-endopeptidase [Streptosporangiaceae bacterium]